MAALVNQAEHSKDEVILFISVTDQKYPHQGRMVQMRAWNPLKIRQNPASQIQMPEHNR
jgi:hypothetical protein